MVEDKVEDKIKDNIVDDVKDKKEDDVVGDVKEKNQVNTKSYSLNKSISVNKDNMKCASTTTIGNIEVSQSPSNATTLTNMHSTSAIGNDTESEREKEKEGKN